MTVGPKKSSYSNAKVTRQVTFEAESLGKIIIEVVDCSKLPLALFSPFLSFTDRKGLNRHLY